jgi:hypothetical protein
MTFSLLVRQLSVSEGVERSVGVDLRLQIGDDLLRGGDGIGAGDERRGGGRLAMMMSARASLAGRRIAAILGFQNSSCFALRSP